MRLALAAVAVCLVLPPGVPPASATETATETASDKVEASLLTEPDDAERVFWVTFRAQADLAAAPKVADFADRGQLVVDRLQDSADTSQSRVTRQLTGRGIDHESFWISNSMRVTGSTKLVLELAGYPEVERVLADTAYELPDPVPADENEPDGIEWNVGAVRAPEVWNGLATTGEGVVVANIDTGVQFDHPALVNTYRGNVGGSFDHNYSWYDPAGVCGAPSTAPCDNNGHGTHTMGTMVGRDGTGTNAIGVAPGARWIAAKGCESGSCSWSSLMAAGQWLLAPTDLNGQNPRPDLRPNVVNNSWGGPGQDPFFRDIVTSWIAAGIFPVFSNGNSGPGCGTAGSPADYVESYAVGAYDAAGFVASFSSRGSSSMPAVKPDIGAPGVAVRSSVPGNTYAVLSGTSMAGPHVAAAVALMWSASPTLMADVAATKAVLDQTAVDIPDLSCGGTAGDNGVWGEGRVDAYAAVESSPRGPTGTLAGVVRDEGGQPLPGATVGSVGDGQSARRAATDAAGEYRQRLPAGTYQVTVAAFGYLEHRAEVVVRENETTVSDHALVASPRYSVSGTIVDASGVPLEGVTVSVAGASLPAQSTDAVGAYRFTGVPQGDHQLLASGGNCMNGDSRSVRVDADSVVDFSLVRRTDGFGHACVEMAPAYIEADTVLALTGDDQVLSVLLPFPFTYYGASYTAAHVSTNGLLGLAYPNTSFSNGPLPDPFPPNATIYPFWDDLYVDAGSSVRTSVLGSSPDRRFVVEWRNVRFYSHGDTSPRLDFEVVLDEAGGILLQYRNIASDPMSRGASATIGLEDASGGAGFNYSSNQAVLASPGGAVRFDVVPSALPIAEDDVFGTAEDTASTVPVLDNDHDPDGDPLRVSAVSDPPHGVAILHPEGTITYAPDGDYNGLDSFTYDVADGRGGTATGRVSMSVSPVNDLPRPWDDNVTVLQDTNVVIAVLANDTDPDGDVLTPASLSPPAHGVAVINPDRTVTYRPVRGYIGSDSFHYVAVDGNGGALPARVSVWVDRRKTIQTPLSVWTYPGAPNLDGAGNWVIPFNEPTAGPGQMAPAQLYSHSFWFSDLRATGAVSLGTGPAGKHASLAITRANGTTGRVQVPYQWVAGGGYFLLVHHLGGGNWGAWVIDGTTGAQTTIGTLAVSPQHQKLHPATVTNMAWSGPGTADCATVPLAQAFMLPPAGYTTGTARASTKVAVAGGPADCSGTTLEGPGWVYYALGLGV